MKIAYNFAKNTSFSKTDDFDVSDIIQVKEWLYGLTFSIGYNKWNLHLYYGLNDLFDETEINNYGIDIRDLRVGLIFYIF